MVDVREHTRRSFGRATFCVEGYPDRVEMTIHDGSVIVASSKSDIYNLLFNLVKITIEENR